MRGSRLALAAAALAGVASAAAAQRADVRTNAQLYVEVERSLRRAELEASCGGLYAPRHLHRVIDLRAELRSLRRFAERDGELDRLHRIPAEEEICVSPAAIEPNLRRARRGIDLLRFRARRSGQWPARPED
ncbi:MAG TPA: hypothetical protein VGW40_08710 [Allosphingosinicella sp.]|nr:hypothetical protein [Allosphingosinicella sp.]